ncbi:MAG: T9SS type A sorting domain-containing protein [Schleiferiaceae bacterium]|nr:T9SS type A sorting domain-containing protein [Schleiferiaceae bacterium]
MVASSYPVDFSPNDPLHLSYAHVASRHAGTQDRNYSELQMDIKFVRAIDTIGSVCLRNDNHISIPELEHSLLNIFPNPANDYIVFRNDSNEEIDISIINSLGQTVAAVRVSGSSTKKVDISTQPSGIYYALPNRGPTQKILIHR